MQLRDDPRLANFIKEIRKRDNDAKRQKVRATLQANAKNKNARVVISKNQTGRQSVDLKVLGNQVGKSGSKEELKTSPEDHYISH